MAGAAFIPRFALMAVALLMDQSSLLTSGPIGSGSTANRAALGAFSSESSDEAWLVQQERADCSSVNNALSKPAKNKPHLIKELQLKDNLLFFGLARVTTFGKTMLAGQRLSGEVLRAYDLWPYKHKGGYLGMMHQRNCLQTCRPERLE
ncbi:MAG: hypothetical protein FRX49_03602 [Trebouxia sp. A1-2]|nr:MAG: hypothetical protein FRX49_03602 [Trebouxia sp. A1-2]